MNTEKLEKLFELKEKGVITEEEFKKQKEELLSDSRNNSNINNQPKEKKQSVFLGLAFFLGLFGIHNFYIGQRGFGLAKLGIFLVSTTLGAISAVSGGDTIATTILYLVFTLPVYIWVIIEMFDTHTTALGKEMIPTIHKNTIAIIFSVWVGLGLLFNLINAVSSPSPSVSSPSPSASSPSPSVSSTREKNVWCAMYFDGEYNGDGWVALYNEDIIAGGGGDKCIEGGIWNVMELVQKSNAPAKMVSIQYPSRAAQEEWRQYDKQTIIFKGTIQKELNGNLYIYNPRFIQYN